MPPSTTFTKEMVIRSAVEVARESGFSGLSARKIARHLGSSTAPVYQHFASIAELSREALLQIKDVGMAYMGKPYTERHFLNIGIGFAVFAREEKELFKAFYLENDENRDLVEQVFRELQLDMPNDPRFKDMPGRDRTALLRKMWTFTFGLATQICYGLIKKPTNAYIRNVLLETGTIIIADALSKQKPAITKRKSKKKRGSPQ